MPDTLYFIETDSTEPYYNLALEEALLRRVGPGQCILYLWQNRRTVVIGRNQNAENECRIPLLEAEGGFLARRLSGGGAVYHDLGNLNFTFLMPTPDFNVDLQTEVILRAVQRCGIQARRTGRNDLTVEGRKFSGHAYYHSGGRSYHHGTLMVEVETGPMERYLNPSRLKMQAKGVPSVRSRVGNLRDWNPELTVAGLKEALKAAFQQVYSLPAREIEESELDPGLLEAGRARFASPQWKYGRKKTLNHSREARFDWGTVRVDFSLEGNVIEDACLWSDGLEADYLERVPGLLRGVPLERAAVCRALAGAPEAVPLLAEDLAGLITGKRGTINEL